ncbi:MAG: hypothetical protein ABIK79_14670 [Chloroflexota bacterium]|nr:hypothetical protein [Anaerolineae bacterium]
MHPIDCRSLYTGDTGHTSSDTYLVLPEERVAFLGDLGFFQCHPFLATGDPQRLMALLEEIGRSDY